MDSRLSETIRYVNCKVVINNWPSDEKDREIEKLKAENKLLKEQLRYIITDDTVSNSTTDNNNIYEVVRPRRPISSISSQPATNRFQTNTNDLNDFRQDNDSPNIACDTDQTEPKLKDQTTPGTASRERPYDEVSPVYRENIDVRYTGASKYLHAVHYQSTSVPPPLPERNLPALVPTYFSTIDNTSEPDYEIYEEFYDEESDTPSATRPQDRHTDNDRYQLGFPKQDSDTPHDPRPHNRDTDNDRYQLGFLKQDSDTPNAGRTKSRDRPNHPPSGCQMNSYEKVVDEDYLTKSKLNVVNRDLAKNFHKGETKIVRSKRLSTEEWFV